MTILPVVQRVLKLVHNHHLQQHHIMVHHLISLIHVGDNGHNLVVNVMAEESPMDVDWQYFGDDEHQLKHQLIIHKTLSERSEQVSDVLDFLLHLNVDLSAEKVHHLFLDSMSKLPKLKIEFKLIKRSPKDQLKSLTSFCFTAINFFI